MAGPRSSRAEKKGNNFGTFAGVFTPCVLTICGVIMFLRTGYVVGNAGLRNALLILLIAKSISLLTTLSLSAIATNTDVKGGGAYFLISRSIGSEFGGSIGITLYLAQAISVSLYIIGFTEAFCATFALGAYATQIALAVCVIMFGITYVGASWAIRVQFVVLAALLVSIASFVVGGLLNVQWGDFWGRVGFNWTADYQPALDFWVVFAIYFPAVTGIMAGASMSGDLANPRVSIPKGTLLAVGITSVAYALLMLLLSGCVERGVLQNDTMILKRLSLWGPLVDMGIWAATLSSALGSFVGAPRVLQALARDRIFPSLAFFGSGSGPGDEPRKATVLTFALALLCLLAGDLNVIAPIITMFFLITYCVVNFACFYESRAQNPSFRPTFRAYNWVTALVAALGCVVVMFLINRLAAAVSLLLLFGLYKFIERKKVVASFGDAKSGYVFRRAVDDLERLEHFEYHPKNWRPQILVLSGNPKTRPRLVNLADSLVCGRGLLIVANVLAGPFEQMAKRRSGQEELIRSYFDEHGIVGFTEVVVADTFDQGFLSLVQNSGIGRLKPNVVVIGWCENEEGYSSYAVNIRRAMTLGLDVLLFRHNEEPIEDPERIDVWWRGRENGHLMVTFAYLLSLNDRWSSAQIRVFRIIGDEAGEVEATKHMQDLLDQARVDGHAEAIVSQEKPVDVISRVSGDSDLVFLGMGTPEEDKEEEFMNRYRELTAGLRNAVLVRSTGRSDIKA